MSIEVTRFVYFLLVSVANSAHVSQAGVRKKMENSQFMEAGRDMVNLFCAPLQAGSPPLWSCYIN